MPEVRAIRQKNSSILGLNKKAVAEATDADLVDYAKRLQDLSDEQDGQIVEILKNCLGLTDDDIKTMEYLHGAVIFNELFDRSTIIRKNSLKPSSSPSEPITSTPPS